MPNPIKINTDHVATSLDGKTTIIRSQELTNQLIHDPQAAIAVIKEAVPSFKLKDLEVARDGRLVIKNVEFTSAIATRLKDAEAGNGVCGAGCGAAENLGDRVRTPIR
ncbi:MAG TPA: hypothetical protein VK524_17450 [Polyangiaceae bacterium]|nr:hypothetical protein [Polyangiaceae bacterium]